MVVTINNFQKPTLYLAVANHPKMAKSRLIKHYLLITGLSVTMCSEASVSINWENTFKHNWKLCKVLVSVIKNRSEIKPKNLVLFKVKVSNSQKNYLLK